MWQEITLVARATSKEKTKSFSPVVEEKETKIFADRQSVKRQEYYKAMKAGDQATAVFKMWKQEFKEAALEYEGRIFMPTVLLCEGERFEIGRNYSKGNSDQLELTCKQIM